MSQPEINPLEQLRPFLPPHLARNLDSGIDLIAAMTIAKHIKAVRREVSTYLPRYLVHSIIKNPEPGRVSGGFKYGAVLFADVSGFTAMSEKLSVLGKEGAEEVTSIVNNYFSTMLEINDKHGGDLLKFGGDALLIFFEGNLGPHKALAMGQAMMDAMHQFTQVKTSQGTYPLRMKIGMACGTVFLASLGTPESMDHAVMGSTLYKMVQSEENATAGEIVVHDDVKNSTGDIASYVPVVDGYWKLEHLHHTVEVHAGPAPVVDSREPDAGLGAEIMVQHMLQDGQIIAGLHPFVPEELFTRITDDPHRIAVYGSHRPVTITFTNFLGIDPIIETLGQEHEDSITSILNRHFITMSEVITRFGGTVNRLDAYSKGHRILGLFGALQAHEDDPQRAVRAGVEMNHALVEVNQEAWSILDGIPELKDQFDEVPLTQRIGINSGFVFGCNTGSKNRREYTVMGDQVNLTARLMGIAAEGEVLIGESTARQAEETFNLVEKEAVKVKGKTDPVKNFVVTGIKEQTHWKTRLATSPIIGRDKELQLGREAIQRSISGKAQVLVISGVSGLGKTRLAEELAWYGDSQGMDLLIGTCLSYGKTMTYHPWAEVLREIFGIQLTDDEQDAAGRVASLERGLQAIDEGEWAPVLGTVIGLDVPDNDLTRDLDPKLRRQRVLDLTVKLLKARAHTKPLMLVIEDAHWADPASMDLIDYVARNISSQPILFMLPHRPDIGLPEWTAYPHAVDMELPDLSDDSCKELIHGMLGGLELPPDMYEIILSRGCGNPFFIGEVVRALIDAGALEKDAQGIFHVIQDMSQVELPDTIHGVIISRIDRLLASDRNILQVASVIGRVFAYRTLDGVYPYEDVESALRDRLNYLNELGLTEIQVLETELYRFMHLTTREVVYEGLPFEQRRGLHRSIGGHIEDISSGSLGEQTNLLAYHYFEGQAWEKALQYNLVAAQHAQREFANDTAILSGERALEAANNLGPGVDTTRDRLAAHETMGGVLTLVGRYDESLEHFDLAQKIVADSTDSDQKYRHLADLSRKTAEVYERRSEFEVSFDWLDKATGYLDLDHATIELARIYLLGTGIHRRLGQNDDAALWCEKSLETGKQIPTREGRMAEAQAYYNLGGIFFRKGDLQQAIDFCQQSIQVYQEIDHVVGEAKANNNLGTAFKAQGEWDRAREAYHSSLAINRRIGDIVEQGAVTNNLGNIYLYQGDWLQANAHFSESNMIWEKIGAALPEAITLTNLAQVNIYQGNLADAERKLNKAEKIFTAVGSQDFLPELERRWGEYYLKKGELRVAIDHANISIDLARKQDSQHELGLSCRVMGEIYMACGEFQLAKSNLEESYKILTDLNSVYDASQTSVSLAQLAFMAGEPVDQELLSETISTLQKLGAQVDMAQALEIQEKIYPPQQD
jgi:class 3 adenylate cyclase/tetratricopeptide (TPR) repeat protein